MALSYEVNRKRTTMKNFNIEAYTPKEIAARIEKSAISKSSINPGKVFMLALLAGAFIAFGAALYTTVIHNSTMSPGITRLLGGLVFCLGLILVVVAGAELFTGNNLLVMAYVDMKITLKQLLLNWLIVFIGNFIGSLGFMQALTRGILCNALVCLAVWLCFAGHNVTDKILAIIFPITAFVAMGFEHSVANMYFIPAGMLAQMNPNIMQSVGASVDVSNLNIVGFMYNMLPVTLGNIIGGSVFVGLVYWFIYLRE
jgi:formate/nitrite transporter FocA (FNT family)